MKKNQTSPFESDVRRAIVLALRERSLSAGEISQALDRPRPGISHHLSALLEHRLVRVRQTGAHRFYSLNVEPVLDAWDRYLHVSFGGPLEGGNA